MVMPMSTASDSTNDAFKNHTSENPPSQYTNSTLDRLTVFSFLWACQALVHQEFYSSWLDHQNPRGWAVTIFAVATMLRPSSLILFGCMLISSIVYNVVKWPFVVNHILMESFINLTILAAILSTFIRSETSELETNEQRNQIYDRFAPVVYAMLVIMYWFAFNAKLNYDFINPDVSCVVFMYDDLIRRFPFVPDTRFFHYLSIYGTLVIEFAIPLLLTFRRTRHFAIFVGLPFHFMLGLIGHRTFSGLAYALYGMICMDSLVPMLNDVGGRLRKSMTPSQIQMGRIVISTVVVVVVASLIGADLAGEFRAKIGPLKVYQIPWLIWIGWSAMIFLAYSSSLIFYRGVWKSATLTQTSVRPTFAWFSIPAMILLGFTQYLGLKSETCFTMYSNLRTEGDWNNHFFMPALRVTNWQDDLIEIVSTDHSELKKIAENHQLMTFFEFRRLVTNETEDFSVVYKRRGELEQLKKVKGQIDAADQIGEHPVLLGKIIYFRPVSVEECMPCQH